jgi:hypothetical protein
LSIVVSSIVGGGTHLPLLFLQSSLLHGAYDMTDDARTTNTHATYFKAPGGTILSAE